MRVMGTNTWDIEIREEVLIKMALRCSEDVKSKGIAELQEAYIDNDQKLLWCSWKTDNLEGLQAAFDAMNEQSGLKSKLAVVEQFYP